MSLLGNPIAYSFENVGDPFAFPASLSISSSISRQVKYLVTVPSVADIVNGCQPNGVSTVVKTVRVDTSVMPAVRPTGAPNPSVNVVSGRPETSSVTSPTKLIEVTPTVYECARARLSASSNSLYSVH